MDCDRKLPVVVGCGRRGETERDSQTARRREETNTDGEIDRVEWDRQTGRQTEMESDWHCHCSDWSLFFHRYTYSVPPNPQDFLIACASDAYSSLTPLHLPQSPPPPQSIHVFPWQYQRPLSNPVDKTTASPTISSLTRRSRLHDSLFRFRWTQRCRHLDGNVIPPVA